MTAKGLKGRLDRLPRPTECSGCDGTYPDERLRRTLVKLAPSGHPPRRPPYSACRVCKGVAVPPPTEPPSFG